MGLSYPLDKTYTFEYNVGGNIISKNEYVYTTGTLGTPTKTYSYAYSNGWKDQLTSFDGQSITYDASGNPTSYLGKTLTWDRGRLLTRFVNGTKTVTMQYDANGIRKSKTVPNMFGTAQTTEYVYDNSGKLLVETVGTTSRYYIYSNDGIVGYEENGEQYLYRKNLFGDITAIYKGTTKVAEYQYDAWGNCTITLDKRSYGTNNPFRYRGYYYDSDLQMYYLLTRYYDPKTGRFINADSIEYLEPETINGLNLYAYCRNNPVMRTDSTGTTSTNETNSFIENVGVFLWNGLVFISNSVEYFVLITLESITYDVGFGAGFGGEIGLGDTIALGALVRQDLITIEKQAGPLAYYTRIGQKYEEYVGLSCLFGFIGKGKESFYYFNDPNYSSSDSMETGMDINIDIGVGIKFYILVGVTFEMGFDLDYFLSSYLSDRFDKMYGYK